MTTADVISILECNLVNEALQVVNNHDYGISCDTNLCRLASDLFAIELNDANPDCEKDIVLPMIMTSIVPDQTPVNTEEDCNVIITDTTSQTNCLPMTIIQQ